MVNSLTMKKEQEKYIRSRNRLSNQNVFNFSIK